jgi:hypothetical protein
MKYPPDFETFWKCYPSRWDRDRSVKLKRGKRPAYNKWVKLTDEERAECMGKRKMIYAAEGSYPRDCVTWLNQYGWEDIEAEEDKWEQAIDIPMKEIKPAVNLNDARNEAMRKLRNG